MASLEACINIDPIDFERVRRAHRPDPRAFTNPGGQNRAAIGIERFAIVETANGTGGIEHHSRREHGSEQRASSGFIEPGDHLVSGLRAARS